MLRDAAAEGDSRQSEDRIEPQRQDQIPGRRRSTARHSSPECRSAQAHRLMARLAAIKGDHAEALAESERALHLNPWNSDIMMSHAIILARAGRAADGVAVAKRARTLNFYAPTYYKSFLAFVCFFAGEFEKGLTTLQSVQGSVGPSRGMRIACLAALGRLDEARAEVRRLLSELPDFDLDRLLEGFCLSSAADHTRFLDALRHAGL